MNRKKYIFMFLHANTCKFVFMKTKNYLTLFENFKVGAEVVFDDI